MFKTFRYLVLVLIFIGCSGQRNINGSPPEIEFIELGYGLCSVNTGKIQKMDNSPSGIHYISSDFNLIKRTSNVPAEIGQRFGVAYILKSPDYKEVQVEVVWIFPKPISNSKNETFTEVRYVNNKRTNEDHHETYALNSDYLIEKGNWMYQMFIDGKKMYEREFNLE